MTLTYAQMRRICACRAAIFSNNVTGGQGDSSTDPGASEQVDPNTQLAPIVGGSKSFNIIAIAALVLIAIGVSYLVFKQFKK